MTSTTASQVKRPTGIKGLDDITRGGLPALGSTLVIGNSGTGKTVLCLQILANAAATGESGRNMSSIGVELKRYVENGTLYLDNRDSWQHLVEEHYIFITQLLDQIKPDLLVIDPISALMKAQSAEGPYIAAERLISITRSRGITTIFTSLTDDAASTDSTLSHVSTLADTWISLSYSVHAGERNRALSVVKSRGAAHSNQVRELRLSSRGLDLEDVYQYGSEVLMGTARLQKESEVASNRRDETLRRQRRALELENNLKQARERMKQAEVEALRLEKELTLEQQHFEKYEVYATEHSGEVAKRRLQDEVKQPSDDESSPGEAKGQVSE